SEIEELHVQHQPRIVRSVGAPRKYSPPSHAVLFVVVCQCLLHVMSLRSTTTAREEAVDRFPLATAEGVKRTSFERCGKRTDNHPDQVLYKAGDPARWTA